ncbi:MAG: hypothetical protein ACM3SY_12750 [Candidatus Omnitrophota bacterium]
MNKKNFCTFLILILSFSFISADKRFDEGIEVNVKKSGGITINVNTSDIHQSGLINFTHNKNKGAQISYYPKPDTLIFSNNLGWDAYLTSKGNFCIGGYSEEWALDRGAMRRLMVSGCGQKNPKGQPIVMDIARFQGTDSWIDFDRDGETITGKRDLVFRTSGTEEVLRLTADGRIQYKGNDIHADYVFESGYKLPTMEEQSGFMWKNKHLPAVPARGIDMKGNEMIDIGAHTRGIVEELEKAHIYIDQLNNEVSELKKRLQKLEQEQRSR